MAEPIEDMDQQPVIQPRLVRLLKNRPRLVNHGFRQEVLEELEKELMRRRAPDSVAEGAVREFFNRAADSTAPPVRRRMRARLQSANEGILENL